jgi:hypothetical protein
MSARIIKQIPLWSLSLEHVGRQNLRILEQGWHAFDWNIEIKSIIEM